MIIYPFRIQPMEIELIHEMLTSEKGTCAQSALVGIWCWRNRSIPFLDLMNVAQAQEYSGAMQFGPMVAAQTTEINQV